MSHWFHPRMYRLVCVFAVLSLVGGCAGTGKATWRSPRAGAAAPGGGAGAAPHGAPPPQPVPGKVMLGSYLDLPGKDETQSIATRTQQLGRGYRIIHEFFAFADDLPTTPPDGMPTDAILMISWRGDSYQAINSGGDDAHIAAEADRLARYAKPVFLRYGWEMNGDWYDWDGSHNGKNPGAFVSSWRHIHDIFVQHGATNVAWVWGPNWRDSPSAGWNDMNNYYPGDQYVDWIGVSGYFGAIGQVPSLLFNTFYKRYAGRKPLMIAETAALEHGGQVKADWIDALHKWVAQHPAVAAVVWFDTVTDDPFDWRIDSSSTALAAYRRMASDPLFSG